MNDLSHPEVSRHADGTVSFAGQEIGALYEQTAGATYFYSEALIRARVAELKSQLQGRAELHYAIKANPFPPLVHCIADLVDGLDVASGGELALALKTNTAPADISFAGPGKSKAEIELAVVSGITLHVESETELNRALEIAEATGKKAQIAFRVNPDFELKSSGMKMAGGSKQFGIDAEKIPQLLKNLPDQTAVFRGFHIFSGSQNLSVESIGEAQRASLDLALDLAGYAPHAPDYVNLGGGFGIPYFPHEQRLDTAAVCAALLPEIDRLERHLPATKVVLELGRYLVGEAGIFVCEVIDKKDSRGVTFLITDGGLHHHLSLSGNFGQVIRKNYPVEIVQREASNNYEQVEIVGPLCTPLDVLGAKMDLPEAQIGDLVVVLKSGAYGFTASPRDFLSHPHPQEVWVTES